MLNALDFNYDNALASGIVDVAAFDIFAVVLLLLLLLQMRTILAMIFL